MQKNAASVLEKDVPLGDRKNTAFMGTVVSYGRGRGVVTSTGMHTQLGLIASMLQNVEAEETPLQRRLDQLGKSLSVAALFLVAIVFIVALINSTDISLLFSNPLAYLQHYVTEITDVFIIAVSLAIAAVPEGLPAVVTISLALGHARDDQPPCPHPQAVLGGDAGSATVICSDKTGTLTQNEMTVTRLWADGQFIDVTGTGYIPEGEFQFDGKNVDIADYPAVQTVLWLGLLNNDASIETTGEDDSQKTYRIVGDPTEGALLVAAAKAGVTHVEIRDAYPRENEVPFDSERKRMVTIHDVADAARPGSLPVHDQRQAPGLGCDRRQRRAGRGAGPVHPIPGPER